MRRHSEVHVLGAPSIHGPSVHWTNVGVGGPAGDDTDRMTDHVPDGLSPAGCDLRACTDRLRPDHPVIRTDRGEWVLLRHDLVGRAALDPETFSSATSRFRQVPNGLDGEEHTAFREALDPLMSPAALARYGPVFERIAAELIAGLPRGVSVDGVADIGAVFAVRAQSAWLGWPAELEGRLLTWMDENHAAVREGDLGRTAQVAEDFAEIIRSALAARRSTATDSTDTTGRLLAVTVQGRRLTDVDVVSVLRNWTGGDLGSIALCAGVLIHELARDPRLQSRIRDGATDPVLDGIIDEVLRRDSPFIGNRRTTTRAVDLDGVHIPAGARVKLHWTSANRDESVFGDPDAFDPVVHAPDNLVYGVGRHACPGRALASMELRALVRALLAATTTIRPDPDTPPEREVAPVGGWAHVPVLLT
mgnify:CR=1 FL=1